MHILLSTIITAFISFIITFYLVPICCTLARRLNFQDVPDGTIKKHTSVVPYLGGVAVYGGFAVALALMTPFENQIALFFIGVTLLLFVGLVDDLIVLTPAQKFGGQIIAAICFLKSGFYLKEQFVCDHIWSIPISFLWVLSLVNAFNLIDVMDGLACVTALCAAGAFLIFAITQGAFMVATILAALMGSLAAFLMYNRPPAVIYLGDAGALFIGGVMAVIPFLCTWGTYNQWGYCAPVIILAIPLLELVSLIIIRTYKGIPFYKASPDHFSLYLFSYGWSKYKILFFVVACSAIVSTAALLLVMNVINLSFTCLLGVLFLIIWTLIINNFCKIK